jgi:predicted  nucleic acid-binding Zn-ribbon protein
VPTTTSAPNSTTTGANNDREENKPKPNHSHGWRNANTTASAPSYYNGRGTMHQREHRLRLRIDQLLDERENLQTRIQKLEKRIKKAQRRLAETKSSRQLWRHRATR